MTFEETIATLRGWIGQGVAVSLARTKHGLADGYLADFSGTLAPSRARRFEVDLDRILLSAVRYE